MGESKIREATEADLPYLVEAGRQYAKANKLSFDTRYCREAIRQYITGDHTVVLVHTEDDEAVGHCAASCATSLYGFDRTIRVVSTWGKGGLMCLKQIIVMAFVYGYNRIIVDAPIGSRVDKAYRRMGFTPHDTLYIKDI